MKKRIISFIFVLLILVASFPYSIFASDAKAVDEPEEDLSETTIVEDFAKVFNGEFNADDYVVNKADLNIKLVALTEYENAEGKMDLYIYIYNPSQRTFYERGTNMVTLSYENDKAVFEKYDKFYLEKIDAYNFTKNTSNETNATLIKYKINGINIENTTRQRGYCVSELELQLKNGVLSFPIGKSFVFTEQEDGTYDVLTNEKDVIVIDELEHTYYRVQSSNRNISEDIRTVYFAVDKDIVNKYGIMTTVDCRWKELETKPFLLLDNQSIVTEFKSIAGDSELGDFKYSFGAGIRPGIFTSTGLSLGHYGTDFAVGFNTDKVPNRFYAGTNYYFNSIIENVVWSEFFHNTYFDPDSGFDGKIFDKELDKIYLAMYCSYDNGARVSSEKLKHDLDKYDGKCDGFYADELFSSSSDVIQATFTIEDIESVDKYEVNTSYLDYLLNFFKFDTEYSSQISYNKFELFDEEDLSLNDDSLSRLYLIDKNDVDSFRDFAEENSDCYIYFLRYSVTETKTLEASVFGGEQLTTGSWIGDALMIPAECYVCNGSLVETVFVKDFDIITLGYEDVRGVYTVVPVSTEPTDSIVDVTQLEKPLPNDDKSWLDELIEKIVTILKVAVIVVGVVVAIQIVFIVLLIINIFKGMKRKVKTDEKKNN